MSRELLLAITDEKNKKFISKLNENKLNENQLVLEVVQINYITLQIHIQLLPESMLMQIWVLRESMNL